MTIRIGIVGARGLSTLQGFRCMADVEVAGLCDIDEAYVKEAAAANGIPHTYRVFEDMLDSDIDAVVISTPMQLHVPQAIAALQAGKHVLSEVTAGVTLDELLDIPHGQFAVALVPTSAEQADGNDGAADKDESPEAIRRNTRPPQNIWSFPLAHRDFVRTIRSTLVGWQAPS